jgi:DNA-binding Lrp family transcriptional regulator
MQQVYVHINSEPGTMWEVANSALKIAHVKMAHAVTGDFDVVIYAELDNIHEYSDLIETIQALTSVTKTQTSMVIPQREESIL